MDAELLNQTFTLSQVVHIVITSVIAATPFIYGFYHVKSRFERVLKTLNAIAKHLKIEID